MNATLNSHYSGYCITYLVILFLVYGVFVLYL